MRVPIAVSMILSACGFSAPAGQPVADAGDGIVADVRGDAPSTIPIDGPAHDRDIDGVDNASDNCPDAANPEQHDHDRDMRGDACDPCPHFMTNTDSDGDGVGNVCDPRPGLPGDRQALFVGFYSVDDTADWASAGAWTYEGGTARQTNLIGVDYLSPPDTFQRAALQVGVTIDNLPGASSANSAVIIGSGSVGSPIDPSIVHWCAIISDGGGRLHAETREGPDASGSLDWPEPHEGVTLRLGLSLVSQLVCTATRNSGVGGYMPKTPTTQGQVTLIARRAAVRFDYLFVVEIGP